MRLLTTTILMMCTIGAAQSEIACTRVSACWETGRTIRIPNNPANGVDTKIVARGNRHRYVDAKDYKTLDEITPNQQYRRYRQPIFNSSDDDQGD
jgi:hypothetical protein